MTDTSLPRIAKPPHRVLFFGKNMSRSRATGGLVEALRGQGLEVRWMNLATHRRWVGRPAAIRNARRAFARFKPDMVFVFCRDLPFSLLREFHAEATTVVWVEEPLQEFPDEYIEYLAEADAVFITNPSKLAMLRSRGVHHAAFVLEGFSSTFHYPLGKRSYKRDIAFIGGPGREGKRAEFLASIARHHDLEIFGCHWDEWRKLHPHLRIHGPVRPRGYRKVCAESRIVLGLNQVNRDSLYFSNRTFLTLACGGFHLTHYVPGLERVFRDREHLCWYRDLDDCIAQIDHYLARPEDRERIAVSGRDYVHAEHQFDSRIRYILHSLRLGRAEGPPWLDTGDAELGSVVATTGSE
ncbi:MAG: glycosyltransferase [Planctomycetes bacterium]|nr:glycosyltransferase [Planctomycetota bacterium]